MNSTNLISNANVARICELANFDLSLEEMSEIQGQLECILGYVEKLKELNVENIDHTIYGQAIESVYREDVVTPCPDIDVIMANAPERIGPEFKVPKIVE